MAAPAAFCLAYTAIAMLLLSRIGLLAHLGDVAFSQPDSRSYRAIADFLAGDSPHPGPDLLGVRPLLYPLFLATYHWIGIPGLVVLQWGLNLTTVAVTFLTVRRLTGSGWLAAAGAGVLVLHPTFSVLALHAMSESLALTFVALAVSGIVQFFSTGGRRSLAFACFFLSAASCSRPVYLPLLLAWGGYASWWLIRSRIISIGIAAAAAMAISPVLVQLLLAFLLTGQATISTAGRVNFEERFFPAVTGFDRGTAFVGYRDAAAQAAKLEYPALADKVRFVMTHPVATVRTVIFLLRSNLGSSSGLVRYPPELISESRTSRILEHWSKLLNRAMALVHLLGIVVLVGVARSKSRRVPGWIAFLACMSYVVILSSVLTYWQGDRLLLAAVPIWIVAYAGVIWHLRERIGTAKEGPGGGSQARPRA